VHGDVLAHEGADADAGVEKQVQVAAQQGRGVGRGEGGTRREGGCLLARLRPRSPVHVLLDGSGQRCAKRDVQALAKLKDAAGDGDEGGVVAFIHPSHKEPGDAGWVECSLPHPRATHLDSTRVKLASESASVGSGWPRRSSRLCLYHSDTCSKNEGGGGRGSREPLRARVEWKCVDSRV